MSNLGADGAVWPSAALGELCKLYQPETITHKDLVDEGMYPVYGANGVMGRYDRYNHEEPQLVIGCRGACGSLHITPPKSWITGNAMVVQPRDARLDLRFLRYFFEGPADIPSAITGAAQPQLTQASLKPIKVPLPSLDEQKRIVAKLDHAFAALDRARANAEANLEDSEVLALRLKKNLIQESVGEIPMLKLGDCCDFVRGPFGGSLKKSIFKKSGFAVYEQQHAIHRRFKSFRYFVDQEKFDEMARYRVRPGDVIMSCSGTMGRVAVVPNDAPVGIINQALLKLSPSKLLLPEFLKRWMESAAFQLQLSANKLGVAIENVASVSTLKLLEIPILSLDKQAEIVEAMDAIDLVCSEVRQRYDLKSCDTVDLRQSLLQAAFSGQLT